MTKIIKRYSDLSAIPSFEERLDYLMLNGSVGDETFGGHRYLNQALYSSNGWHTIRREVILRDDGCDLAHEDYPIDGSIYIHHLNPITMDDILNRRENVFDLENLVCVSFQTHNFLHYGNAKPIFSFIERKKDDTCPWR